MKIQHLTKTEMVRLFNTCEIFIMQAIYLAHYEL